jgi:AmmeMemoRadiSam system protein B
VVKSVLGTWLLLIGLLGCLGKANIPQNLRTNESPALVPREGEAPLRVRGIDRNRDLYLDSVATETTGTQTGIAAPVVIVPHHLLASSLITAAFAGLDRSTIKLVILVSPDHFGQTPRTSAQLEGQTAADLYGFGTTQSWNTPFGVQAGIESDLSQRLINSFPEIDFSDAEAYQIEHGVYGLVPFIMYYFPDAQLLALSLVPAKFDFAQFAAALGDFFLSQGFAPEHIQVIISTDFVHHGTVETTRQQDDQNLSLLRNLSLDNYRLMNNDCRQGLAFALGWLGNNSIRKRNTQQGAAFILLDNKNSHDFGGPETEITSYITAYLR